jgi:hypothetical protein
LTCRLSSFCYLQQNQQQAADQAATQWFFTGGPVTGDGKTYLPGLQ